MQVNTTRVVLMCFKGSRNQRAQKASAHVPEQTGEHSEDVLQFLLSLRCTHQERMSRHLPPRPPLSCWIYSFIASVKTPASPKPAHSGAAD